MTEHATRETIETLRDAIAAVEDVTEIHTGPRSNELWFRQRDGREVRVAVQVIERMA